MEATFAPAWSFAATEGLTGPPTLPEPGRVLSWRLAQLADAGYSDDATAVLATRSGVDLHRATDLLLHGCSHQTALRILL
jgi:hypothetical protein